ncbi:gamma-glutamyltransferase [Ketogulonicigenium vulgare]|uniref:Gamma-glutamyltransferase 1 n=1 Tax=Ketogulonicigenium vulgare (strain WSH-001) TaxID=759362 RepID=F9YAV6_KETVW|nr:gamma-glutamyltransferase [Ketogulonicigenium vulgare]ADO43981.1 Acylase [Ketogulonicigenium vulgare Y25]AEM42508.1 gamma-glutamyltransferase 1 [Ketogulonicigenium vulgare WSH-001]ALJ82547.1 gamma-glutamyltransferase [Ketogulonicigenium vulgare]ANW35321.1 gamma-glutamyltransferase [Ketogulonicigenium vulgare]AOZ53213.1 Acylase [Ketogulonicigenium vulgare]
MHRSDIESARHERWLRHKPAGKSANGVVTAQHYIAAEAGARVLEEGGNAVDAAVTTALTMQTVEPWMSGLAACGYMQILHPDGSAETIEFTGRLPAKLDMQVYAPDDSGATYFNGNALSKNGANVRGMTSAVIPGAVRGFALALQRYGTIGFDRAIRPARDQAAKGMTVDWHTSLAIGLGHGEMRADPVMQAVYQPGGKIPGPGAVLHNPQLAATLARLHDNGPEDLYTGQTAAALVADLNAGGSSITAGDLAAYAPKIYPSLPFTFAGHTIFTPGPTSGGARLRLALLRFEQLFGASGAVGPKFYADFATALRHAYCEKIAPLTVNEHDKNGSTTQINAVDREGRFVAITFTLLNRFGAYAMSPSTGILLNNGMAWFDPRPGKISSMAPNAYAHNNMCPVAIAAHGKSVAVLGASGGNMIVPALAQITAMHLVAGYSVDQAVSHPRIDAGPTPTMTVNVDMTDDEIAAVAAIGPIRAAQNEVMPRPFASPAMTGRDGDVFIGMPDTSYPPAAAAPAQR